MPKLTEKEFTTKAIVSLRKEGYKGIHAVYSGFNDAFEKYFGTDPKVATTKLQSEGQIAVTPAKGGVMLYLPKDKPESDRGASVLKKMGITS
jgi:hypothetical protein